jgi:hypothetical protein
MHDIDTLLDTLKQQTSYNAYGNMVTMPIPLYESIRRILKEIQQADKQEIKALEDYLTTRGLKCTNTGLPLTVTKSRK